jgi:hypothetical protein
MGTTVHPVHTVLEVLAALLVGAVGILGSGTVLLMRRLHRANRLVAETASAAPTSWLWSWRRSASLHRRLRAACQVAVRASAPAAVAPHRRRWKSRRQTATSPLARVARELVDHAVGLDARLVEVDQLAGAWRRPALASVESEVRHLEASVQRLTTLSAAWRDQLDSFAVRQPDLQDQLDAVEAALDDLAADTQLPRGAGLRSDLTAGARSDSTAGAQSRPARG